MPVKREEIVPELRKKLGGAIVEMVEKSPRRVFIEVKPADVPETTRVIFRDMGARLQIATGRSMRWTVWSTSKRSWTEKSLKSSQSL
jgi:Ni,Fe-hydrogenase III component G